MNILSPKNSVPVYTNISEPVSNLRLTLIVDQTTVPKGKRLLANQFWAWTDDVYDGWKRAGQPIGW
jgi:hypothetical protein